MPGRSRVIPDARLRAVDQRREIGRAIRTARSGLGATQAAVGRLTGRSGPSISRIERGRSPGASLDDLVVLGAAVGLRIRFVAYPDGPAVRDEAQVALLRRFRARIGLAWRWQLEVPMPIAGDRRAVDAVISAEGGRCVVEAIVRVADMQAQLRAMRLKTRDLGIERLLLVVADTHANRRLLAGVADVAALALPVGSRAALRSLRSGRVPPGDALIVA